MDVAGNEKLNIKERGNESSSGPGRIFKWRVNIVAQQKNVPLKLHIVAQNKICHQNIVPLNVIFFL